MVARVRESWILLSCLTGVDCDWCLHRMTKSILRTAFGWKCGFPGSAGARSDFTYLLGEGNLSLSNYYQESVGHFLEHQVVVKLDLLSMWSFMFLLPTLSCGCLLTSRNWLGLKFFHSLPRALSYCRRWHNNEDPPRPHPKSDSYRKACPQRKFVICYCRVSVMAKLEEWLSVRKVTLVLFVPLFRVSLSRGTLSVLKTGSLVYTLGTENLG